MSSDKCVWVEFTGTIVVGPYLSPRSKFGPRVELAKLIEEVLEEYDVKVERILEWEAERE